MTTAFEPLARPDYLIWDMVVPLDAAVGNDFDLVDRFHAAGHNVISLTIAGDDCGLAEATHRLARARRTIAERSDRLRLIEHVDDIARAKSEGKLAVGLHLEGTGCLERDVDALDLMYALGIRHAILAFNLNNSAAGGCADLNDGGLTKYGRRLLDRMSEIGMLLDLSHMGERSSLEAIDRISRPAVFTHSNVRALHDHYRNVSDEQARACAASGGLIGVSGSTAYLGEAPNLIESLFRHIDYLVNLIGPDHVGLGTDYVEDSAKVLRIFAERPDEWPTGKNTAYDSIAYLPPEGIEALISRMERAGYGEAVVKAILGGNYLRIARDVWS